MTTSPLIWTPDDQAKLLDVCRTPHHIDASEFLTTFFAAQWKTGARTRDVLHLPEVEHAILALLRNAIVAAKGGDA